MQIRWGICGCGAISGDFVNALRLLPEENHKIVAVAASSKSRADQFVESRRLDSKTFDSYSELFAEDSVDVVYIGLLNNMHRDVVVKALNAGKNVLCEKPLGLNLHEVEEMISVAKQNNKFLMEGFWTRCFPAYKQLKKELDFGTIGEAKILTGTFGYPNLATESSKQRPELGGGTLMAVGSYLPMLALYVFGEKPVSVRACGFNSETGVDDTATLTMVFSGNRIANLLFSGSSDLANDATIYGSNGKRIRIPSPMWCPTTLETPEKTYFFPLPDNPLSLPFTYPKGSGLAYEADCVRDCISAGQTECKNMMMEETLKLAEVLQEARKQLGVTFPQDQ